MSTSQAFAILPSPTPGAQRPPQVGTARGAQRVPEVVSPEPALGALYDAYRASGGLLTGEEVALRLRSHHDQPLSLLARWIVAGELLSVETGSQTLIPLFQFDPATMTIRTEVADLMAELSPAFDSRELAFWFVEPNAWLHGATPVEALVSDPQSVLDAARADRFVATGWA